MLLYFIQIWLKFFLPLYILESFSLWFILLYDSEKMPIKRFFLQAGMEASKKHGLIKNKKCKMIFICIYEWILNALTEISFALLSYSFGKLIHLSDEKAWLMYEGIDQILVKLIWNGLLIIYNYILFLVILLKRAQCILFSVCNYNPPFFTLNLNGKIEFKSLWVLSVFKGNRNLYNFLVCATAFLNLQVINLYFH